MKKICKTGLLVALTSCLCVPAAHASFGMLLNGYGAKSRGMGGVGLAMHEDSLITAINPAGTSFIDDRADGGLLVFNPKRRAVCCLSPEGQVSDKAWFFLPNAGLKLDINENYAFGFGMVGYAGGRTSYRPNIFDADPSTTAAGVNLEIGMMSPTISYKVDDKSAVGVSLLIAIARFEAQGLGPFQTFSKHPDYVSDNRHDWSYGAGLRFGWQRHFDNDLSLAAVIQTETYMTGFDDYKGLFAEEGKLNLPPIISLGLAYQVTPELQVAFDWSRTFYEEIPSVSNPSLPIIAGDPDAPNALGADGGPGFEWENQDVFKVGAQYDLDQTWTLRGGLAYGEYPIHNDGVGGSFEFNVLAPVVTELHASAGATYRIGSQHELSFSIMRAFNNSEEQDVPVGTGLPFEDQTITLEMEQWSWDFGYGYKF